MAFLRSLGNQFMLVGSVAACWWANHSLDWESHSFSLLVVIRLMLVLCLQQSCNSVGWDWFVDSRSLFITFTDLVRFTDPHYGVSPKCLRKQTVLAQTCVMPWTLDQREVALPWETIIPGPTKFLGSPG